MRKINYAEKPMRNTRAGSFKIEIENETTKTHRDSRFSETDNEAAANFVLVRNRGRVPVVAKDGWR